MRAEADRLQQILRPLMPGPDGAPSRLVVRPIRRGSLSRVFRGDGTGDGQPVVIKICIDPATGAPDCANAAAYFAAMQGVLELSAGDPRIGCSKPLLLLEAQAIVVASWIDGPTVEHVLQRGTAAEARAAIIKSGAWLARFHSASGLTSQTWDMAPVLGQLDAVIARAQQANARMPLLLGAAELLHRTAAQVGVIAMPWSRQHGDFKPGNLILSGDTVAAIDIDYRPPGPCIVDAAQFLNHAALQRPWRLAREDWIGFVEAAFHQGAAQGGVVLPALPLAWTRLHHGLRTLIHSHVWSKPPKIWITGWYLRSLLRHLSRQLILLETQNAGR